MAEPLPVTYATPPTFCEQKEEEERRGKERRRGEQRTGTGEKKKEYNEDNVRMSACLSKIKKNRIAPQ